MKAKRVCVFQREGEGSEAALPPSPQTLERTDGGGKPGPGRGQRREEGQASRVPGSPGREPGGNTEMAPSAERSRGSTGPRPAKDPGTTQESLVTLSGAPSLGADT